MKCGRVKPLAYPVCAGKGSLKRSPATSQKRSASTGPFARRGGPVHTFRQSRTRAPVARFGVWSVSVLDILDDPAGSVTSCWASTTRSVS